jgi:regulator of sirC expression with transglutaminase-like and TPR domain
METTKEISALFNLIDDPDEEVFGVVSDKIIDYGKNIIPSLEHLWETIPDENIQQRIELLWNISGHHDLIVGALLLSKFQYPDLSTAPVMQEIEKIRRNIWLELNNYLTPLEQINIVTSILYSYYGLKGNETSYLETNDFFIQKVLETKKGNQISNGILYLVLAELLDIPVKAINIPKQFVLAYLKPGYSEENLDKPEDKIEFYIDPIGGQIFTQKDVHSYFKRIGTEPSNSFFKPQNNKSVIQFLLKETSKCFDDEKNIYKQKELLNLANLLD